MSRMCTSQAVAGGRIAATLLLCFVVEALLHTCFSLCQKVAAPLTLSPSFLIRDTTVVR